MLLLATGAMYAQSWDTSGNGKLSGTFYFRQVVYSVGDTNGDFGDAGALYGQITFDGNGHWSINGNGASNGAVLVEASNGTQSALPASTGTYSIGASGYGFIASPLVVNSTTGIRDQVMGLVGANGVFIGTATDTANGYNDVLIAAKIASPVPTASSFTGTWTLSSFDPNYTTYPSYQAFLPSYMINALFNVSPNGSGQLSAGTIKGYYGGSTQAVTQSFGSQSYTFSNGAAVTSFPNNGTLIYGQKYFYFSPDGNFLFGGAPNNFDLIVGVKTNSSPTFSGLYYQVGFDENGGDIDTYFGSFNALPGSPQTLLGHQRVNDFGGSAYYTYGSNLYDYTYTNPFTLSGSTYSNSSTTFIVGANGVMITSGIGGSLQLSVSLPAAPATGSGVFLNPQGIVNAASYAPFTARIAPGELLTLYGSNLAPSTKVAGIPFPTTGLNGVTVTIGGLPAPIYYVSAGQISAIVPYGVTVGSTAAIQVNNNGTASNTVYQYVGNTSPGVFTQNQAGTGYGLIEHLGIGNSASSVGSLTTDANPSIEGETLAAYLTGLGNVSPPVTDGAPGPASLSSATSIITVDISGATATNLYSGLAPGYSGLYQLNFTNPATGVTVGPNYLDVGGWIQDTTDDIQILDSYMSYQLIPVQDTAPSTASVVGAASRFHRKMNAAPTSRLPRKKLFTLPKSN